MTSREALAFVKASGIVLESARRPVPNLADLIAGEPIRGSWWGHRKAAQIFRCSRAIRNSKDVLVCRLVGGKVTYVHRRLWPALVKVHDQFEARNLSAIREVHTPQGKHKIVAVAFPRWVPGETKREAARLTSERARELLGVVHTGEKVNPIRA
jgi:hypothetical protein